MISENLSFKSIGPDGDVVTQVKAQVMTRDDSTGGWVPVSGGGLSIVALVCRKVPLVSGDEVITDITPIGVEFVIQGRRITDHEVILDCTLMMDLQYIMVNPTFHHWQTGNKRYGLTFQSSSDAHIFEQSIRAVAYETVREYRKQLQANGRLQHQHQHQQHQQQQQHRLRMISTDEDIFMMLRFHQNQQTNCDLVEGIASVAISLNSQNNRRFADVQQRCISSDGDTEITEEDIENDMNDRMQMCEDSAKHRFGDDVLSVDSSYVRFAKTDTISSVASAHDYCYPTLQSTCSSREIRQDGNSRCQQPPTVSRSAHVPCKLNFNANAISASRQMFDRRRRCVYCGERFEIGGKETPCDEAPNRMLDVINVVTCACVADAVAYHCLADEEGDYEPMCSCSCSSVSATRCALLVLLSFVLPCLCCFWPLMGCRRCAVGCGWCVGRHRPE